MKLKTILSTITLMCLSLVLFANTTEHSPVKHEIILKKHIQEPVTVPAGTIIQLKTTKYIYAKNFKS